MSAERSLFAGPYFGEFGHEVMGTGLLRAHVDNNEFARVIVCSRPECAVLYSGIATEFRPHAIKCDARGGAATSETMPPEQEVLSYIEPGCERFPMPDCGEVYTEAKIVRLGHYIRLGTRRPEWAGVTVFHARNRSYRPDRNWPEADWKALAKWVLGRGIASRIVCVGTREGAAPVDGCIDMRGSPLEVQMDIAASAHCTIGPSSGWMHLASLCGCPHLTWVGGKEHVYVRRRYVDRWNPLRTRVAVIPERTWQPSFETVSAAIASFLGVPK